VAALLGQPSVEEGSKDPGLVNGTRPGQTREKLMRWDGSSDDVKERSIGKRGCMLFEQPATYAGSSPWLPNS
jgi:hypothetical protein